MPFLCVFVLLHRFPPTSRNKRESTSDIVPAQFVYGGRWLAAAVQDSLGTGPVRSRQVARDEMKQLFEALPHKFAFKRQAQREGLGDAAAPGSIYLKKRKNYKEIVE